MQTHPLSPQRGLCKSFCTAKLRKLSLTTKIFGAKERQYCLLKREPPGRGGLRLSKQHWEERGELFCEVAGGEGEGLVEGGVPVFPGVAAVAHAEFQRNLRGFHGLNEFYIVVEQEIIIAAVNEPFD